MERIDLCGLKCPKPLLEVKKYIKSKNTGKVVFILDDEIALTNVTKFLDDINATTKVSSMFSKHYVECIFTYSDNETKTNIVSNEYTVVIDSLSMGSDPKLGESLLKTYLETLLEVNKQPKQIILYNEAVLMTQANSLFFTPLKKISQTIDVIICGACLKYFDVNNACGRVSNMFEIIDIQSKNRVVKI